MIPGLQASRPQLWRPIKQFVFGDQRLAIWKPEPDDILQISKSLPSVQANLFVLQYKSRNVIQKEIPIKILFSEDVARPRKFTQHIKRVRVYGPSEKFPEEIRLHADEIAEGGVLTIDDLNLPKEYEVTDRRESDKIITVERAKKEKRPGRGRHDSDDYDD